MQKLEWKRIKKKLYKKCKHEHKINGIYEWIEDSNTIPEESRGWKKKIKLVTQKVNKLSKQIPAENITELSRAD